MEQARLEWAEHWLKQPKRLYIGGEWAEAKSGKTYASINPANQAILAELPDAGKDDVQAAAHAARKAFQNPAWKGMARRDRARVLRRIGELVRKHQVELATLESLDNGKTFKEALNDDMPDSADVFDYYAGWTDKLYGESCPVDGNFVNYTTREPIGVCALIVPWNFPLLLAAWKMAPALAMGNTIIVKPAPFTSLSLLRFAEILHDEKVLPKGVLNVVLGGNECGEALTHSRDIAKVSFTGSTEIGKKVVAGSAASNLKSITLELGGKAPVIFFEDTPDLEGALDRSFNVMFKHKGEKCTEPTRFFLHEKIYARAIEKMVPMANKIVLGDPFDPATDQGPQCHEAHMNKILSYIEIGKKEGAKLLAGGHRDTTGANAKGFYVRPTIFGEVSHTMRIAREEIFGPVLCLIPFKTEEEVIRMANDSDYGLAAGLYTADVSRAHRVASQLDSGMVFVNHYGCYDFSSPFGGWKESGWGKEMALHSLEAFTKVKSIWIKY